LEDKNDFLCGTLSLLRISSVKQKKELTQRDTEAFDASLSGYTEFHREEGQRITDKVLFRILISQRIVSKLFTIAGFFLLIEFIDKIFNNASAKVTECKSPEGAEIPHRFNRAGT